MRLAVVLLGAKKSGKSSLANSVFGCPPPELQLSPAASGVSQLLIEHEAHNVTVVDTKEPETKAQKAWLGQQLARRTVKVALVTVARDACHKKSVEELTTFARKFCPKAFLGLVVTKNDLRSTAVDNSMRTLNEDMHKSFLSEHAFESSLYDIMQNSAGVNHLFYTSSRTKQGNTDLLHWVLDKCTYSDIINDFGVLNELPKSKKFRKKKKTFRQSSCSGDYCDTCVLQ